MDFSNFGIQGFEGEVGSNLDVQVQPIAADLDNDGILESMVQGIDTDRNGIIDNWTISADLDHNGTFESIFQGIDTNQDGQVDSWTVTSDLTGGKTEQIHGSPITDPNGSNHQNLPPQTPSIPGGVNHNSTPNITPGSSASNNSQLQSWERWSQRMEDSKSVL